MRIAVDGKVTVTAGDIKGEGFVFAGDGNAHTQTPQSEIATIVLWVLWRLKDEQPEEFDAALAFMALEARNA